MLLCISLAPRWLSGKESTLNTGDSRGVGSIYESRESLGGGNGNGFVAWKIPWIEEPSGLQSMGWYSDTTEPLTATKEAGLPSRLHFLFSGLVLPAFCIPSRDLLKGRHFAQSSCCFSVVRSWTAVHQPSLFSTGSWSLFSLICIDSLMPSNHLKIGLGQGGFSYVKEAIPGSSSPETP